MKNKIIKHLKVFCKFILTIVGGISMMISLASMLTNQWNIVSEVCTGGLIIWVLGIIYMGMYEQEK